MDVFAGSQRASERIVCDCAARACISSNVTTKKPHRTSMLLAFVFSSAFLISYIVNHALHGDTIVPGHDPVPDHKNPKGTGGAWRDDHPDNIQGTHWWCNEEKGSTRMD
jgi:hypothetical protein